MGLSMGSLFGDSDGGGNSSNQTTNVDSSNRAAATSQQGAAIQGSSNVVNDAGLVSLGLKNNELAGTVLSHIADTTAATLGKLSDTIKQTSNDTLGAAISTNNAINSAGAATAATNATASNLFAGVSDNMQKMMLLGAAALGAWFLLGRPGQKG